MNLQILLKRGILLLLLSMFLNSCASKKSILYLQNSESANTGAMAYENTLQPDDNLLITITADEPELANDFNLLYINARSTELRQASDDRLYTYLVDPVGEIDFPIIGKIKLGGLTRLQAEAKIKDLLKNYIKNAGVSIRVTNFKVSVIGEVKAPGSQNVIGDRITLLEAISQSGDLTVYGKRKEILVIREKDGVKTVSSVDITKADFINSPYYYLAHNDVVYVKPNQTRINSSVIGPNITVAISAISLVITIIALSTR